MVGVNGRGCVEPGTVIRQTPKPSAPPARNLRQAKPRRCNPRVKPVTPIPHPVRPLAALFLSGTRIASIAKSALAKSASVNLCLLGGAAEKAGNLPGTAVLGVAKLVGAEARHGFERDVAGFAGWRRNVQERLLVRVFRRRVVGQDPDKRDAEFVDDRRVRLAGAAHFDAVLDWVAPFRRLGIG